MPSSHRRHAACTPARIVARAETIGPSTAALCETIMTARPHPEQGLRTCQRVLAMARACGRARLDAACRCGVSIKARSVASTGLSSMTMSAPTAIRSAARSARPR